MELDGNRTPPTTSPGQDDFSSHPVSRREFGREVAASLVAAGGIASATLPANAEVSSASAATESALSCTLTINGTPRQLKVDPRTTLLDLLRENLHLTGTKKGCDHGQCGACTVLVNGRRVNSCLTFAVMHDGDEITSIEGFGGGSQLHPMQAAFIDHDGFQCGYCTPGQVCSAVAMLTEAKQGIPSAVTKDVSDLRPINLTDDEIRERMSGNICRCGAYVGIVDAIRAVNGGNHEGETA